MNRLVALLNEEERFQLPRTETVKEQELIDKYDKELIAEILKEQNSSDFSENSYDLIGVDFVFSSNRKYQFRWKRIHSDEADNIGPEELRKFIREENIPEKDILGIRITIISEDNIFSIPLKESIEFTFDAEKVTLLQGRWTRFNEDYISQLNQYVREIDVQSPDPEYRIIPKGKSESVFNKELIDSGKFSGGDKDFSKFEGISHVEAWDLRRDYTVYAIKFGNARKLEYVCSQASMAIELIKSEPQKFKDIKPKQYCLWLGLNNKRTPQNISGIKSLIFKQQLESWAHKAREAGITPVISVSRIE